MKAYVLHKLLPCFNQSPNYSQPIMTFYSYKLGDCATIHHAEKLRASELELDSKHTHAASKLKVGDFAMIRQSEGIWRCALVSEIFQGSSSRSPFITFTVTRDGCIKNISHIRWASMVRPLKMSVETIVGAHPRKRAHHHATISLMMNSLVIPEHTKVVFVNINENAEKLIQRAAMSRRMSNLIETLVADKEQKTVHFASQQSLKCIKNDVPFKDAFTKLMRAKESTRVRRSSE